jgi:hypothetical protein
MRQASSVVAAGVALSALVFSLTCAGEAFAQAAADKTAARKLFEEGKTKREHGDKEGALEAFTQADAIMMVPTTRLAVARALVAMDRLLDGRESAASVEKMPVVGKESQPFADARAAAAELVKELDGRIPSLSIVLPNGQKHDDVSVSLDGLALQGDGLGLHRVDPGKHNIVATIAGRNTTIETVLAERETKTITLKAPEAAPDKPPPVRQQAEGTNTRPIIWAGVGLVAVGAALGTVAGVISMGKTKDLDTQCTNNRCPPPAHGTFDSAHTWATVSTIGFIGAGVGAVTAGVGLLLSRRSSSTGSSASSSSGVRASVTLGGAAIEGTF